MDLEEIGINAGNWVGSAKDRNYWMALVNAALNLRVPYAMELVSLLFIDAQCTMEYQSALYIQIFFFQSYNLN